MTDIVRSEATLLEGEQVRVTARSKEFLLDEPTDEGGTDLGMKPTEALLGALGGCKCIVAKRLAAKMGIELVSVKVLCEAERDRETGGFAKITSHFYITTDEPEDKVRQFIEKVDQNCPVHITLAGQPQMEHDLHYNEP